MKSLKKVLALLLAFVLLSTAAVTAFAASGDGYTITINITDNNKTETHEYEAYQIFSGDLSGTKLSNVQWGSGVTLGKDEKLQVT